MKRIISAIALAGLSLPVFSQDHPIAFTNARIYTISGGVIENGTLVVHRGKITDAGAAGSVTIPAGGEVRDMKGKTILPGLVDTHSHLGSVEGGDRSHSLHPDVRALDAIDPGSDGFMKALAGGITTLNVMPGSGHLMSGQTLYLKLREGSTLEDLAFCDDLQTGICGGMKMANGTNSIREDQANFPGTRAKSAALVRELFTKAQEYRKKLLAGKADPTKMPERDLQMEALVEILEGRRIVHFHTHRANDVLTAIRLSHEFGFKVVLHHVSEAWMIAGEIAKAKAPCSIIVLDAPGGKLEAVNLLPKSGAALEKAGVSVAFHTDDPITDSRRFLRSAALAVREGMSREKALEGLTLAGAKMLGLEDKVGSLEKGKDADFVILSGDPFSVYTRVEQTWVEGSLRFDFSKPEHRKFALGGYNAFRDTRNHENFICE